MRLLSGTGFSFLPKELVCGHAPVDGNLIVFLHLDPVNQLRDVFILASRNEWNPSRRSHQKTDDFRTIHSSPLPGGVFKIRGVHRPA